MIYLHGLNTVNLSGRERFEPVYKDQDWVTWNAVAWESWLAPFKGRDNLSALEIGTYEGRSAVWWLDNILTGQGCSLTCIDPWINAEERHQMTLRNLSGRNANVIREVSEFAMPVLIANGWSYDFIYVDGCHQAAAVLRDHCLAWILLKKDGVLIADDYRWTSENASIPPKPAIDAFLHCYSDRTVKHEFTPNTNWQCAIWK